MTTNTWSRCLVVVALLVAAYALLLVVAGPVAARLFDALGFGLRAGAVPDGQTRDYVLFVYGVLGAVLAAWAVLIAGVAAGPLRAGEPWAWPLLAGSLGLWFVLDTGMSLAVGQVEHAVFNLLFAAALGVPLLGWRRASRRETAAR